MKQASIIKDYNDTVKNDSTFAFVTFPLVILYEMFYFFLTLWFMGNYRNQFPIAMTKKY